MVGTSALSDVPNGTVSMMVFASLFTTPDTLRFEKLNAVITFCGVEACSACSALMRFPETVFPERLPILSPEVRSGFSPPTSQCGIVPHEELPESRNVWSRH